MRERERERGLTWKRRGRLVHVGFGMGTGFWFEVREGSGFVWMQGGGFED